MQLNTLRRTNLNKDKSPRVGRGGKRGTTAGKGTKGQKSRSGHRIRPAIRDLVQRTPKLRGYANKPKKKSSSVINLDVLAKINGLVVDKKSLLEAGLIRSVSVSVKILGKGEVAKAFKIEGLLVSESAKAKIEKAGGTVNL